MSADRLDDEEFVDDRHDDDPDPFDIVPEGFVQSWNATSIREALRKAEQATGKTDPDEFPRCPECGTIRISRKPGTQNMPHKRSEAYKCPNGHHFDEPAPSREAMRDGEQATLREVSDR